MKKEKTLNYAGFWIRSAALLIDVLLMIAIAFIVGFLIFKDNFQGYVNGKNILSSDYIITTFIAIIAYNSFFTISKFEGTPGKILLGLKVVNKDGSHTGIFQIVIRVMIPTFYGMMAIISAFAPRLYSDNQSTGTQVAIAIFVILPYAFIIGSYLMAAFTKQNTTLFDLIVATRVVRKRKKDI